MKQDLYSNEWISAENQSTEINLKTHREEEVLIVSLKIVFEYLNVVKSYSLWEKCSRPHFNFLLLSFKEK